MANFDIINAAGRAYQTSWNERQYLLRLAAVPFLLNVFCASVVLAAGFEMEPIKKTLCMVPALLAEGWMLSHFVRLIVLGHRWPYKPTGNMDEDIKALRPRARGVLGGAIVFVLINMASYALVGILMNSMEGSLQNPEQAPPSWSVFAGFATMIGMIWMFRIFWLYIAYAINMDYKSYFTALRGMFSSLPMFGVFLMCFIPFFVLHLVVGSTVHQILAALAGPGFAGFSLVIVGTAFSMAASLVATAGITYGLSEIFEKNKGKR